MIRLVQKLQVPPLHNVRKIFDVSSKCVKTLQEFLEKSDALIYFGENQDQM